jgi:branched-chain amino acid transport system ATP-binding protein
MTPSDPPPGDGKLTPEEMSAAMDDMPICGTAQRAIDNLPPTAIASADESPSSSSSPSSDGASASSANGATEGASSGGAETGAVAPSSPSSGGIGGVTPVLELRDVAAGYGPFRALFGLSLTIAPGEAVALLGANGAGKTTVARVATGLVAPTSGSVHVEGADLTGSPPWRFARAGVIHAPEGRSVFATLSVEENLTLSFRQSRGRSGVKPLLERAFELFPVLGKRRHQMAGTMSGGEQRMLSMARVLVESPKVLVADELSLGLAPVVVDEVYESLDKLRGAGTALLIVEQHVGHALALCSRVVLQHHGGVQWEGPSSEAASRVVTEVFEAAS